MIDDKYSRRDFLKKFAYLSSGALLLSTTSLACYGPPPGNNRFRYPTVSGMYYLDAQAQNTMLQNSQAVPVHTKFTIEFTEDMSTSARNTVLFTGPGDAPVDYNNKTWETARILSLTPTADLTADTTYTLRLADDFADIYGNQLVITDSATATFKTALS